MRSSIFWDVRQRGFGVIYGRFGTTNPSHFQGSSRTLKEMIDLKILVVTDISGQSVGPFFKGQALQETDCLILGDW